MNFSVLMSLYAKENPRHLAECFESLRNQSLLATQIVLVLDGPITQELKEIIESYLEILPLKIINLPQNVGLGKALNEGLKECSYDLVCRMDTDDIAVFNRFEKQITFMKENPDIIICGGQIEEFSECLDNKIGLRQVPLLHDDIMVFSKKRSPFNHISVAYRKNMIIKLGGYEHHLWMEDYNLWIRALASGYKTANLPEILCFVRSGDEMLLRRRGMKYVKSEWKLARLKSKLKYQNNILILFYFFLRSFPRLMPKFILRKIYKSLRK